MLMLAVELDERRGFILQRGRRDERIVDESAAASLGRDLTPHDELRRTLENGLDGRL